ncbi:DAK1/DegV-like protein [Dentipellis sp. KUC8613]|nr:DAK1/DegV-like protein [Dentipellis sp. KUC8613]
MSNKHVFNSPQGLVLKSLRGAVSLNPSLRLHAPSKSVYVARPSAHSRVALVAGGGAGHEPAHAAYTGRGMLASSVSGDIFASPSARQILTAIELALLAAQHAHASDQDHDQIQDQDTVNLDPKNLKDMLLIINNYTGDRLNFGLALTRARALYPALAIDAVVVADDVSLLKAPTPSLVGPRGLAGNILVCKVLGAYAETGAPLADVKKLGDAVVGSLASVGVGLEHCHVPGRKVDASAGGDGADKDSAEEVCEVGMGLHNEPGVRKGTFSDAEGLVGEMLGMILTSGSRGPAADGAEGKSDAFLRVGKTPADMDETVLFVNNLGGMSHLEMGALLEEALLQLRVIGVHPRRIYSSSYMTSLNAPGFSLSLLNLSSVRRSLGQTPTGGPDDSIDLLALLDAPTQASAWSGVRSDWPETARDVEREEAEAEHKLRSLRPSADQAAGVGDVLSVQKASYWRDTDISVGMIEAGIRAACARVLELEGEMTAYDTIVGDGDCGETFAAGAKAVIKALDDGDIDIKTLDPAGLMRKLGEILEDSMGGTIGALLAIFFTSLSTVVPSDPSGSWHDAPARALTALSAHTPARPGDRTIVDALSPFCAYLSAEGPGKPDVSGAMSEAVRQAKEGAENTKGMKARLGRAVYVGSGEQGGQSEDSLPPDPGAWGVAAVLEGLWTGMKGT